MNSKLTQISASAGSGKTYTLTQLFLKHLEGADIHATHSGCLYSSATQGYALSEILAATFTNKAAAEMKERVITTLKTIILQNIQAQDSLEYDTLNHDTQSQSAKKSKYPVAFYEQRLNAVLQHASLLNIRTIDSLLHLLVRLSALELRLPPDFEASFAIKEYFTPVYDAFIADINGFTTGTTPDVFFREDGIFYVEALNSFYKTIVQYENIKGFAPRNILHDKLYEVVERLLKKLPVPVMDAQAIHEQIQVQNKNFIQAIEDFKKIVEQQELILHSNVYKFFAKIKEQSAYEPYSSSAYMEKSSISEILTKKSPLADAIAEDSYCTLQNCYNTSKTHIAILKSSLPIVPVIPLAYAVYERMLDSFLLSKHIPGVCIYGYAIDVLSGEHGVSDALCRLGTQLYHLLLDEFQDTSIEQWQAILPLAQECLSKGGSLTYVGDLKQAIYSWRGGETKLFNAILSQRELRALVEKPDVQSLPANWRSSAEVIAHNNAFFSQLADRDTALLVLSAMFPKIHADIVYDGAQLLSSMYTNAIQALPTMSAAPHLSSNGKVCLYTVTAPTTEELSVIVENRLATLMSNLLERWEYKDIAILIRSKNEAAEVATWLTKWRIPIVTENSFLLAEHPIISRLLALLHFIDYPYDDVNFWEFITGEECFGLATGLSRQSLDTWLAHIRATIPHSHTIPLLNLFREHFPHFWQQWLAPFFNKAGLMSAYDMLCEAIRVYELFAKAPNDIPYITHLLELAYKAEAHGMSSIANFLSFWEENKAEEKLPLPENMNAVRILTQHKAKGLEFPVVVIPYHHRGQDGDRSLTVVAYKNMQLLTRLNATMPEYQRSQIVDAIEKINLLYVSWTRPVYELHAFITSSSTRTTPLSKGINVLLEVYKNNSPNTSIIEEVELAVPSRKNTQEKVPVDSHDIEVLLPIDAPTLGASPHLMDWLPKLKIYRTSADACTLSAKQRGILIHLCLESLHLPEHPLCKDELQKNISLAIKRGMQLFPLTIKNKTIIALEIQTVLQWFASLPKAGLWLSSGKKEQTLMDTKGNLFRVDLLVADADEFVVIDYKTGQSIFETYTTQVKNYMTLLSSIKKRPVRGFIVYLDLQQVVEVQ